MCISVIRDIFQIDTQIIATSVASLANKLAVFFLWSCQGNVSTTIMLTVLLKKVLKSLWHDLNLDDIVRSKFSWYKLLVYMQKLI